MNTEAKLLALSKEMRQTNNQGLTWLFEGVLNGTYNYVSLIRNSSLIRYYEDSENYFSHSSYQEQAKRADEQRRLAHNALMSSIDAFKRNAKKAGINTTSIPETKRRDFVTNWAIDVYEILTILKEEL